MPDGGGPARVRIVDGLAEVPAAAWDDCAGDDNPFLSHAFLEALEASGSATAKTGWLPQHVLVEDADGRLLAAAPLYLKSHSQGEYVFDHGWAQAYERAGGSYYPKLQLAVPFTPVTGPRLLVRPDAPPETAETLIAALIEVARAHKVSSLHVTFPTREEWERSRRRRVSASAQAQQYRRGGTSQLHLAWRISSPRSPRASASRSAASGATRSRAASKSRRSPAAISSRGTGMRSTGSTAPPPTTAGAALI